MQYLELFSLSQLKYQDFIDYLTKHFEFNPQTEQLLQKYDSITDLFYKKRIKILRQVFNDQKCEPTVIGKLKCLNGTNVKATSSWFINNNGVILDQEPIKIGRNVRCGPHVRLLASPEFFVSQISSQDIEQSQKLQHTQLINELELYLNSRALKLDHKALQSFLNQSQLKKSSFITETQPYTFKKVKTDASIELKDNVWIGANTSIAPGVTIGENTIVGTNSLVLEDLPDNVIAFGRPCKIYRPLTASDEQAYGHPYAGQELADFMKDVEPEQTQLDDVLLHQGKVDANGKKCMNYVIFQPLPSSYLIQPHEFKNDWFAIVKEYADNSEQILLHQNQVLKKHIGQCGDNISCTEFPSIVLMKRLSLGNQITIDANISILCEDYIKIKDRVKIGNDCSLLTGIHPLDGARRWTTLEFCGSITLEENVTLKDRVVITPNVTIGKNSFVASNTMVKIDIPENSFAFGTPCQIIPFAKITY